MNLIEQLGGYECAAYEYKNTLLADDFPYVIKATGTKFTRPELGDELLEHRRQHNIFEVGDKVVLAKSYSLDTVHEIKRIENLTPHIKDSETTYFLENSLGCWSFQIKHATDEEIKAGKRLESGK
ncbi:hypothetical protein KAM398_01960 [Acinetobacter sp. KAM398]|uniref:hypothetical protein n=1 Tax=unclassified Acinetobacter TaxID=196816 RepID=UPI001F423E86|nr:MULTISPECIES: hypothetical protein [unclassified Acinetobacter]GJC30217.1 hypothetical protein KAM392_01960 [Acinetobacter sp. KAM392]GJC33027.1 hypothetical protein KAM393_01960 [Acinetobacter sp. KAM393]GJC35856.1 hypothetical protein KAM394_01960 [Acinetobacter sp. KAM394]GJC38569.1 hypothetical protein KAM395_00900 [Acinetobacter sp. KAM395]GJC41394.1 hypothetical protein KAM396_00910 [Acinetobacter sp. KAM396]